MPEEAELPERKGTVSGAVALIVGTSIGSGILALPKKASPAVSHFLHPKSSFEKLKLGVDI